MKGQILAIPVLLLLTACGSKTIDGAVMFPSSASSETDNKGAVCQAPERFRAMVYPGATIRIKNQSGDIIGTAKLGEGVVGEGFLTDRDKAILATNSDVAEIFKNRKIQSCSFPFKADVKSSAAYVVSIDGVQGDIVKTKQEVAAEKGRLILTVK